MQKPFLSSAYLIALLTCAGSAAAAPINVNYVVAPQGSSFFYDFSVNDTSAPNLLSVTLTLPSQITALANLTTPGGFSIFFDGVSHLLDFVEDTRSFAVGSPLDGFRFVSPVRFGDVSFSALSFDSNQNLVTTTGATASAVPEPGGWALLTCGAALLFAFRHAQRHA